MVHGSANTLSPGCRRKSGHAAIRRSCRESDVEIPRTMPLSAQACPRGGKVLLARRVARASGTVDPILLRAMTAADVPGVLDI